MLLLNHDRLTIVNVETLCRGLAVETAAVQVVPLTIEGHLARAGVEGANGGSLTAGTYQYHLQALRQLVACLAHAAGLRSPWCQQVAAERVDMAVTKITGSDLLITFQ